MPVSASDIKLYWSEVVSNTSANGGRPTRNPVTTARHGLLPRISRTDRENGVVLYRKPFLANENAADETFFDALFFLTNPTNGGDRVAVAKGTLTDTQGDLDSSYLWLGCGQLQASLSGGETSLALSMESDDMEFPNGGVLHLSGMFKAAQDVAGDARPGDSIQESGGTWSKTAATDDITYPLGKYLGSGLVMTNDSDAEEWIDLAENLATGEVIGTGDGADDSPALSALANSANGICAQTGKLPAVTATCGGVERTVDVAADGSCSGYCTAGQLDMATGAWTTDITWASAPDDATGITITYRELCYSYSGNVATIGLGGQVANAYSASECFGAPCLELGDIEASVSDWDDSGTAAGTYDEATYPVVLHNDGVVEDAWTVTFTSETNFTVSGAHTGSVGTGNVGSDFAPVNPVTGQPYFEIAAAGWGGAFAAGDTLTLSTHPAAAGIWFRETVPAGTAQESDNLLGYAFYGE